MSNETTGASPAVGDIVHYMLDAGNCAGECRPAIVVKVIEPAEPVAPAASQYRAGEEPIWHAGEPLPVGEEPVQHAGEPLVVGEEQPVQYTGEPLAVGEQPIEHAGEPLTYRGEEQPVQQGGFYGAANLQTLPTPEERTGHPLAPLGGAEAPAPPEQDTLAHLVVFTAGPEDFDSWIAGGDGLLTRTGVRFDASATMPNHWHAAH